MEIQSFLINVACSANIFSPIICLWLVFLSFFSQICAVFSDVSKLLKKTCAAFKDSLRLRTLCKWMWSKGESGSRPGRVAPKCELGGGDKDHRVQPKSWSCGRRQLRSHFLKSPPSHTLGRFASPALIRSRWLAVCWKWKRPKWPRNPSVSSRQFVTTGALGKTTKCPGVYRKCASLRTLDWVRVQAS